MNIVITGTSRGIGLELVKQFADAGHRVLALSRNIKPVEQMALDAVTALAIDLREEASLKTVYKAASDKLGQVDILIHNAGMLINKPFEETSIAEFEAVYHTNVFGMAALTQVLMPCMRSDGHVVAISSMGGIQGSVKFPGLSAYSSSKAAMIGLTEMLAEEYKTTGPSFNALALGAVQTEMLEEAFPGFKAPVTASEMAGYIMDFAINGHKYYNGKVLQVSSSTP